MKHEFFVLLFACLSVRSKVFLVETKDVPSENNKLDSTGELHFTEGEPLVEKSWEFDGCHHLHQHRDYSIHCHDPIDQNNQNHEEYPSFEYDEYHLHEHCPDEHTTEQIVSTKLRSR